MDIKKSLATRVRPLEASAIREMFKHMGQADVISFAGGIPRPKFILQIFSLIFQPIYLKTMVLLLLSTVLQRGMRPLQNK